MSGFRPWRYGLKNVFLDVPMIPSTQWMSQAFPDYNHFSFIGEKPFSFDFKAVHKQTEHQFLFKLISMADLSHKESRKIKEELSRLHHLQSPYVLTLVDYAVTHVGGEIYIVVIFESFSGTPLNYLKKPVVSLADDASKDRNLVFCSLAVSMAGAVRDIHACGLRHRGINPHEFLIDINTKEVKLNGFPWNHAWRPECRHLADQPDLADIFSYIAPEQTGRMILSADKRSNLYSLGVVFYEMLTGHCPFPKNDSLEIIYSHMAKKLKAPVFLDEDIHPQLSDLVLKMLAKSPDERYQSISGVLHDLAFIEKSIRSGTPATSFALAGYDVSPVFSIPKILYGRDKELDRLNRSYERVQDGDGCVITVAGGPGVGKTELIRCFSQHVRVSGGIFLSGKFDNNHRDVPIKGPKTALNSILKWLLTQPPESISVWRKKILDAVSPNGRILLDLVPEMGKIVGEQPRLKPLPPMETNIRFTQVLDTFMSLFLSKDHPVVFFLDDLQWADRESLDYALAFLVSRKRRYFMGIGTYRNDEVNESHPIFPYLNKFQRISTPWETITLSNFKTDDTIRLVAAILGRSEEEVRPLARVVHDKTGGNPFFITQFMTSAHSSGLIHYDYEDGCWAYDMNRISASIITDNVATLLTQKIKQLSNDTLDVLKAASCMGNRLDVDLLSVILGKDTRRILKHVGHAMDEGILRRGLDPVNPMGDNVVEFTHDHLLQAVYHTLPEEDACRFHLAIGRAMVKRCGDTLSVEEVFDIVHQFRQGLPCITSGEEKINLARLNLEAGQRAIESVSFDTALIYFRQASSLLTENSWDSHYELTDAVYNWLAKCEFVLGDFEASEAHYALLLEKAGHVLNQVRIYSAMVELYASSGQIDKAMKLGRSGLALLGIQFPEEPGPWSFIKHLILLGLKWNPKKIKTLVKLPEIRDHEISMALSLLTILGQTSFYSHPRLSLWLALKGGHLAISQNKRYFQDEHVTIEFNVLGAFLSQIPGFRSIGREAAQMGRAFLENHAYDHNQAVGNYLYAVFNRHWYAPIRQSLIHLKNNYRHAYSAKDISNARHGINTMFLSRVFAVHSIDSIALTRFYLGDNLHDIIAYHKKQEDFVLRTRASLVISYYKVVGQFLLSLTGSTLDPTSLDNEHYDSAREYRDAVDSSDRLHLFFLLLFQLKLFVFYRKWDQALHLADRINREALSPPGTLLHVAFHFYSFLAAVGAGDHTAGRPGKMRRRVMIDRAYRKMKRWARLRPDNFGHLLSLMRAEKIRLSGNTHKAMVEYRRAIELSKAGNFNHITALSCEALGNFLLSQNDTLSAASYLNEAKKYYHFWGAEPKVADMYSRYPHLIRKRRDDDAASPLAYMDFTSLVGALQTISKEIEVKKLLSRLMRIIMESASATHAVFISHQDERLFVELESFGCDEKRTLHISEPLEERQGTLMAALVYYVKRILSPVVLNTIHQEYDFMEHIMRDPSPPKSLACLPMMCKDTLVGILYLENTMTAGAFSSSRIDILNIIASQAAISFENASLYEHVIEKEQNLIQISTKLRNLYSELMLTEERERSRIAIDLHDRIGHALALVKMSLTAMRETPAEEHPRLISSSLAVIEQSIEDTRTLSFEISPPILYHLGLGPAFDWLCEETHKKHGLTVLFDDLTDFEDEDPRNERETNILCFQVLRELLFNAVKHAQAQTIRVTLARDAGHVFMTIEDDGIGFDLSKQHRTEKESNKGFGLFSIKERFHLINGQMDIQSALNKGTKITMTVPRTHPQTMDRNLAN